MDRNDELRAKLEEQAKLQAALAHNRPDLRLASAMPIGGLLAQTPVNPEPPLRNRIAVLESQLMDLTRTFEAHTSELQDRIRRLEGEIYG